MVAKPNVGMPVRCSMREARAAKSVPMTMGMGVPARAMKAGWSSRAASATSPMNFSSSPITASSSERPERNTRLSVSYHRGSSWVL